MLGDVTSHPPGTASRVYSAFAYLAFAVTTTWAIAFLADLRPLPGMDRAPTGRVWLAVLVDSGLLLVFALQHSVMARPGVKRRMAKVVPAAIQRSTYVLSTSLCLALMFWQWRRLPALIWRVDAQPWEAFLWGVCALGWVTALSSTFMIDHLGFLGLRQGVYVDYARRVPRFVPRPPRSVPAALRTETKKGLS
jgi:protein-S-isoprenylcysteine O-methyltransferase Ste14